MTDTPAPGTAAAADPVVGSLKRTLSLAYAEPEEAAEVDEGPAKRPRYAEGFTFEYPDPANRHQDRRDKQEKCRAQGCHDPAVSYDSHGVLTVAPWVLKDPPIVRIARRHPGGDRIEFTREFRVVHIDEEVRSAVEALERSGKPRAELEESLLPWCRMALQSVGPLGVVWPDDVTAEAPCFLPKPVRHLKGCMMINGGDLYRSAEVEGAGQVGAVGIVKLESSGDN